MHEELFRVVPRFIDSIVPVNLVRAAPRGNAKSTLLSFALPIWCAVYKKKHYIVIVSDTASQADDFLTNIRNELEDNELLKMDFGPFQGTLWTNSDLILSNNEVRIQALGVGKKIRGRRFRQWRPDLIICDDLENDENTASPEQRKKQESWYTKALSKAGDERTDKVFIGTIIHYDSLLTKILKNPTYDSKVYKAVIKFSASPLWDDWEKIIVDLENQNRLADARTFFESHKDEMLEGTKVLWPEKEDYYNLMVQRIADGPAAFSSEKQNEPLSEEDRRFLPEWIRFYPQTEIVGKNLFPVIFVDPSMGKQGGDCSAIIAAGMDNNSLVYVLEADIKKRHPDLIISDTISHANHYNVKIIGVETNQFQEYFKDSFRSKCEELGLSYDIRGIKQVSDKILRIESLQPDIKNGRIRFKRDQQELIEQLVNFPSAAHDDGPDALEGALSLLGRKQGIAQFYKEKANEANKITPQSFIQQYNLQGIIR